MDTKIAIKKEDPLSDDILSQDESEFFTNIVTMKRGCFSKPLVMQIKTETAAGSSNYGLNIKTETNKQTLVLNIDLRNGKEFLTEFSVMNAKKDNSDNEMDNKIEIKEEFLWMETDVSSAYDDIKVVDSPPIKSPRLCSAAVSGDVHRKLPLLSAEDLEKDTSFCNARNLPENETTETPTAEYVHLELSDKCSDGKKTYSRSSQLIQKNFIHDSKGQHNCKICEKMFCVLKNLKSQYLIQKGKKLYNCKTYRRFTESSGMKNHNLTR